MLDFMAGKIRFVNIAYYKHLEGDSKTEILGDPCEAGIAIDLNHDALIEQKIGDYIFQNLMPQILCLRSIQLH